MGNEVALITLAEHGVFLGTRYIGKMVREQIVNALEQYNIVVVDFSDVDALGPSFADEAIGALVTYLGKESFRQRVVFHNTSADVQSAIRYTVSKRIAKTQTVL